MLGNVSLTLHLSSSFSMKFGKTLNRGFYYGNSESESPFRTIPQHATKTIGLCSQDSPWNQDLSWKVDVYSLCCHSFSRHPLVDSNFEQACCEREQIQVSKFVFPDGIEGSIAGGAAAAEGHVGDLDKKRKESAKREEGGSEIGSLVGSSIR